MVVRLAKVPKADLEFRERPIRSLPNQRLELGEVRRQRRRDALLLAVEAAGIRHRYIKPRRPEQNGKVERSHRVDQEEFWSQHDFATRRDADAPLADWERRYNHERFSSALQGRTPAEKLQAKRAAHHTSVQ